MIEWSDRVRIGGPDRCLREARARDWLGFAVVSTPPASATAQAIEARGLSKSFGDREALREISFGAAAGELLAVIGPNGAGKTTLLSILAGIREPDAGEVEPAAAARSAGCRSRRRSTGA